MSKKIFPIEFVKVSVYDHFDKHNVKSQMIYFIILISAIFFLALLPFIHVNINVKSRGIIRPKAEKTIITSLISGTITNIELKENQKVNKGDTLVKIRNEEILEKLHHIKDKQDKLNLYINDLKILALNKPSTIEAKELQSMAYRRQFNRFIEKHNELKKRVEKTERQFNINLALYKEKVIAPLEFNNYKYELELAESDLKYLEKANVADWQMQLDDYNMEFLQLSSEEKQLLKRKKDFFICAPVSGSIINFATVYRGSYIFANQQIAEISPDSSLIVECYISPKDIGLINPNQEVKFQIDAYNYNEWGFANGRILQVSNDIVIIKDKPVFKVICELEDSYLQLKNNYKGHLKKGMTLQASFYITRRSLYQLLYDKVDNWINPGSNGYLTEGL